MEPNRGSRYKGECASERACHVAKPNCCSIFTTSTGLASIPTRAIDRQDYSQTGINFWCDHVRGNDWPVLALYWLFVKLLRFSSEYRMLLLGWSVHCHKNC